MALLKKEIAKLNETDEFNKQIKQLELQKVKLQLLTTEKQLASLESDDSEDRPVRLSYTAPH